MCQNGLLSRIIGVHAETTGRLFKIIDLDETQVRLRELDPTNGSFKGKQLSVIEYPHFLDRYSIKKEVELLKGWPANNIVGSDELRSSIAAAHCMVFFGIISRRT